ncbi:zinc finger protein 704 isoform X2 [Amia ocellicauda]|uniref:zinc finger protein 704 isoform X2 n=1 Tax=Amia ocellicauda TaxID=2972642 RepID=UPI0034639BD7
MNPKRLPKRSSVGIRLCTAPLLAGSADHTGRSLFNGKAGATGHCGLRLACKNDLSNGSVSYTLRLDDGTLKEYPAEDLGNGIHFKTEGRQKPLNSWRKISIGCGSEGEVVEVVPPHFQKRSPTHHLVLNGRKSEDQTYLESKCIVKRAPESKKDPLLQGPDLSSEEPCLHTSSHIPVPRHRKPVGHADKEVMAATVLSSLSTSPLVLSPTSGTPAVVLDPASRGWKEVLSASYSSSTSGNWSWDASDQSVPSTPSPPLSNDASKSFLLSAQSDDNIEESETTHFLFEDPIPRKRKNSMKVMFKCLWKNCEKVLSTSSGIQRHIRTLHLGRNGDSDYSDGEEDFYYSEIEVNMDTLSEGLSSLTPTSPTTIGPPPVFPPPELPHSEPALISPRRGRPQTPLSQSAPSTLCHIRTDHAYQGPVTHIRTVSTGEKRQPLQHATIAKTHTAPPVTPKSSTGTRKPRGEAKKCRKVYGMEKKDMWCTACRWKKACQRFID